MFFNRIAILFFLLLIGTFSITAQSGQVKQSEAEQKLTALVRQMSAAQASFDTAVLEKLYASDYVEISPIGEVDSREKAIGFYKPEANANRSGASPAITTDDFQTRAYGNFAIVIARFTFTQTGTQSPARPPISFRATVVCRKEKGIWKIAAVQATGIRPPGMPPAK